MPMIITKAFEIRMTPFEDYVHRPLCGSSLPGPSASTLAALHVMARVWPSWFTAADARVRKLRGSGRRHAALDPRHLLE